MKNPVFSGVCTALVTPFSQGKINVDMLERLLYRQWEAGTDAVCLCGTTGEAPTLSDAEKAGIFKAAKAASSNRCLIAGTGSNSTDHALSLSKAAEDAGVDALLVVTPYYNKATPSGLIAHYTAIADCVNIPVILYNVPSRTGVNIPVSVYRELSKHPNIIGVKEASGNMQTVMDIRRFCPDDFYIWSGNDDCIVPIQAMGGKGVISVASNVIPREMKMLLELTSRNNYPAAARMQVKLLPLIRCLFSEVNPIPVKEAMTMLGMDCGHCRLPLTPMAENAKDALQKELWQIIK